MNVKIDWIGNTTDKTGTLKITAGDITLVKPFDSFAEAKTFSDFVDQVYKVGYNEALMDAKACVKLTFEKMGK